VMENKVSYGVGTLDRIRVTIKGFEKPGISNTLSTTAMVVTIKCTYSAAINSRAFLSVQSYRIVSLCTVSKPKASRTLYS
jgi:hypothetical protein